MSDRHRRHKRQLAVWLPHDRARAIQMVAAATARDVSAVLGLAVEQMLLGFALFVLQHPEAREQVIALGIDPEPDRRVLITRLRHVTAESYRLQRPDALGDMSDALLH